MQNCKLYTSPPEPTADESQAYHPSPLPEQVRDEVKQKPPHTMEPSNGTMEPANAKRKGR